MDMKHSTYVLAFLALGAAIAITAVAPVSIWAKQG
jgi:hypothetical protein